MLLTFLTFALHVAAVFAATGVDVSERTYRSAWDCAKSHGFDFAIVRVYQSLGKPDPNGPSNIHDAWGAGFSHVDGYIFPCYSCGNPKGQVDATIDYLSSHGVMATPPDSMLDQGINSTLGVRYGMLWFDIEGPQYWSDSASHNVNFLQHMVDEAKARGVTVGIYASSSQWSAIMGGSSQFHSLPLWYPHWDEGHTMSDFSSFGGWKKPAMKQYAGDVSFCSAGWDKNYY
eukprot:gene33516-40550_t